MDATGSNETFQAEDIEAKLRMSLPDDILILLQAAGTVASKKGFRLYVVGGFVRDLLLGMPNLDIDLVVEGSAIAMAKAMANRFGGEVRGHSRFGTAKWLLEGSSFTSLPAIDFVGVRRESYAHPGALPDVEPGSIEQDLLRRDFSINTLAICLNDGCFGQLLDLFGGVVDLQSGAIRVLHELSFIDDPTRMLRAARYEARLNFSIESRSERLLIDALPLLPRISGGRLTRELMLTLAERDPEKALRRLSALGVLNAIHSGLVFDELIGALFGRLRDAHERPAALDYLALLTLELPAEIIVSLAQRLSLTKADTEYLTQVSQAYRILPQLASDGLTASQVVHLLEPFRNGALSTVSNLADGPIVQERLARYLSEWCTVKSELDGDDLRALGIAPGPVYREILRSLRDARLDGAISSRAEEEKMARTLAERAAHVAILREVQL
jgi:tRNA nucleotidyltransferase (CCA-adding enzyme)